MASLRSWSLVALTFALLGCQSAASTGSACARSSECAEPLVCASGICRDQCADTRDCTASYSCVTFRGAGVCVPPAQPVPCVFNADCGALFCRSGHCVSQCTTDHDCERGTCAAGTCTEPVLTPPAPDGGPAIDAADTGSTSQCPAHGVLCQSDGHCHDLSSDNHACGQCGVSCPAAGACEAGACVCGGMPCAPSNDDCASAIEVVLDASGHGAANGNLAGATPSLPACGALDGEDVFFRVHVAERSVLFATSYGNNQVDLLTGGCGSADADCGPLCTDFGGTYYDVGVFGPDQDVFFAVRVTEGSPLGAFTAELEAIPVGDMETSRLGDGALGMGGHPSTSVVVGPTTFPSTCSTGDAHVFYWVTCSANGTRTTACASSGSGLSLQTLSGPLDCQTMPDGTGCLSVDHVGDRHEVVAVRAVTAGTSVAFDVLGR